MRSERKRGEAKSEQLAVVTDGAKLAQAKGGLKADRVQGADPTDPTGAGGN
jgi:hypothetical protein